MLGAVRFIPREDLPRAASGDEGREAENSSKKRKHGAKEGRSDRKGKSSKRREEKRKHEVKEGRDRKSKHKRSGDDEEEKEYSSDETSDDDSGILFVLRVFYGGCFHL